MKLLFIEGPSKTAIPVNKIEFVEYRALRYGGSIVHVCAGSIGHPMDFDSIDEGLKKFDEIVKVLEEL